MNDIVFTDEDYKEDGDFYNDGAYWLPIGKIVDRSNYKGFCGIFDGNGYSIENLKCQTIQSDTIGFGLFALNQGTIKNLNVTVDFSTESDTNNNTGNVTAIGAICGANAGIISNCHTDGKITHTLIQASYDVRIGGITGFISGGTILNCSSNVNIYTFNYNSFDFFCIGGISGGANEFFSEQPNKISSCYNNGNIRIEAFPYDESWLVSFSSFGINGGIIGRAFYQKTTIENCYNTGTITYFADIEKYDSSKLKIDYYSPGGIAGFGENTEFINCYNVGDIVSPWETCGIVPSSTNNTTTGCYYLNTSADYESKIGTALYSSQMKIEESFEGYDFENIWIVDANSPYPYPQLKNNLPSNSEPVRHTYTSSITKEPACNETGIKTMICGTCNFSLDVDLNMTEHSYSSVITKNPTHTEEGIITYTCICNLSYTEKINKTPEHSYSSKITAPTCTTQGYTTYICPCGDEYVSNYTDINPLAHIYSSKITTQPTHIKDGVKTYTCYLCNNSYTESIPKLGGEHSYSGVITPPTCTENGYTTYTCICGNSYVSDYVSATGHSHTKTVTTPATHLTEGVVTYTCSCGDTYTEIIEKTAQHTFKESIMYHPSCTEEGTKLFSCECGESYTEAIPKTKHIDENDDHSCDICGKGVCSHLCHKSGFMGFIWKIVQFFWKLFSMNPVCECGAQHY